MTTAGGRRPGRTFSVRARILASMLVITAAGMTVAGVTAYLLQRERTLGDIDAALLSAVDEARFIATDAGGTTLDRVLYDVIQRYRPGTNQSTLGIVDGAVALIPSGDVAFPLGQDAGLVDRLVGETADGAVVRGTAVADGRPIRYIAVPIAVQGDAASGIFVSAFDLRAELRPIDDAFRTFALVAAVSLAAIGAVGWLVAGRLLRPLRSLREAAARITASESGERIPVVGTDDVSDLTSTVNGMLDRLDGALTGQRRLLDDVGHELKTPITIVRGHLELMDPRDPADVGATRSLAIDELDRMSGLVRDISALAELNRPQVLHPVPTDVAELTGSVRAKESAISSHDWVVGSVAAVRAVIDPERLTQAMLQLCANAATHGAAEGTIEIGSTASRNSDGTRRVALWVQNDGPEIDEATQAVVFERFRRGSSGRGESGSGLGLSIVAAIATAHGGTVGVVSSPRHGTRFTIDLPLVESASTASAREASTASRRSGERES